MLFAVALLASGQNSTLTGTLVSQIVMEGFLNIRLKPWIRRLITRAIAVVPAVLVIGIVGEQATGSLLILSQVILSLQLSLPSSRSSCSPRTEKNGPARRPRWLQLLSWFIAILIAVLNIYLLYGTFAF